jgi:NADH-quinone oxidoreductase subunit G
MTKDTVKVTIDGQTVTVPRETTILQATQILEIEVPLFCYHPRLSIAGNCRMCLVEVEGSRKPVASCAMPVEEGMVVHTKTPFVRESREGALEFLLLNHPLDCPICDQGGECDLQDITVGYGKDKSRLSFPKRAVSAKDFGPLIKTEMNRCIHCTRCVRFATEVAGVQHLGAVNRGEKTEIVSLLGRPFDSELSGNVIDLCPVGALTSKPYAFKGRPWEMRRTETIDVMDAVGSHVRVDTRGIEVMRILPRVFDPINEEWISDKARFSYDGLKVERLDRPYVKRSNNQLEATSWDEAFAHIKANLSDLKGTEMAAIMGDVADLESMYCLKKLMDHLECPNVDCRQDGASSLSHIRNSYIMNTPIERLEEADYVLLVGTNPRFEAPMVNVRLRKAYTHGRLQGAIIGPAMNVTYPLDHLGDHPSILEEIASGKHAVSKALKAAEKPLIIMGQSVFRRDDWARILTLCHQIANAYGVIQKDWVGLNTLQLAAARVGGLELGCVPGPKGLGTKDILKGARDRQIRALYLLGADEIDTTNLKDTFVIYQGHHGDAGAEVADVILPGCAYTEKEGLYVNTEGRTQQAFRACPAPGEAREDWAIITMLAKELGAEFGFEVIESVRSAIFKDKPHLDSNGDIPNIPFKPFLKDIGADTSLLKEPFVNAIQNFYQTDVLSRHSETMAICAKTFLKDKAKER